MQDALPLQDERYPPPPPPGPFEPELVGGALCRTEPSHGGVRTMGHTPTPSRFGATFRAGVGGGGGGWVWGGRGRGPARGGGGAPDPYIYGLKWPPHCHDHFEVQMQEQKILQQGGGGMVGGTFVYYVFLHNRCILRGSPNKGGQNQNWPTSGWKCYITPAFSGIPKQRGTKSELAA